MLSYASMLPMGDLDARQRHYVEKIIGGIDQMKVLVSRAKYGEDEPGDILTEVEMALERSALASGEDTTSIAVEPAGEVLAEEEQVPVETDEAKLLELLDEILCGDSSSAG